MFARQDLRKRLLSRLPCIRSHASSRPRQQAWSYPHLLIEEPRLCQTPGSPRHWTSQRQESAAECLLETCECMLRISWLCDTKATELTSLASAMWRKHPRMQSVTCLKRGLYVSLHACMVLFRRPENIVCLSHAHIHRTRRPEIGLLCRLTDMHD